MGLLPFWTSVQLVVSGLEFTTRPKIILTSGMSVPWQEQGDRYLHLVGVRFHPIFQDPTKLGEKVFISLFNKVVESVEL